MVLQEKAFVSENRMVHNFQVSGILLINLPLNFMGTLVSTTLFMLILLPDFKII